MSVEMCDGAISHIRQPPYFYPATVIVHVTTMFALQRSSHFSRCPCSSPPVCALAARAQLVGEQTFGKGVVQYYFPINNDGGVKLTVAKYLTPHRCEPLGPTLSWDVVQNRDARDALALPADPLAAMPGRPRCGCSSPCRHDDGPPSRMLLPCR